MATSDYAIRNGHSNYQIGKSDHISVNQNKSEIPIIKPGHFARSYTIVYIRLMFSLYCIIRILSECTNAELIEHCYCILLRLISNFSSYLNDGIYHKVIYEFW